MADRHTSPLGDNAGFSKDDVIRMDASRARRFWLELGHLHDEIKTLATAAKSFPQFDVGNGHMSPVLTVRAFTNSMDERLYLLWAMMNCEEKSEWEEE